MEKIKMSPNLKILIGILILGILIAVGFVFFFTRRAVIITTDKTEYKRGETVRITVRNSLDKSVWYFRACGEPRFWGLQKLEGGKREEVNFFLPELVEGKEVCALKLCERQNPIALKPNTKINHDWQLGGICELPSEELESIESGTYRVFFTYGLSKDEEGFGLLEPEIIFSNEFSIKQE